MKTNALLMAIRPGAALSKMLGSRTKSSSRFRHVLPSRCSPTLTAPSVATPTAPLATIGARPGTNSVSHVLPPHHPNRSTDSPKTRQHAPSKTATRLAVSIRSVVDALFFTPVTTLAGAVSNVGHTDVFSRFLCHYLCTRWPPGGAVSHLPRMLGCEKHCPLALAPF